MGKLVGDNTNEVQWTSFFSIFRADSITILLRMTESAYTTSHRTYSIIIHKQNSGTNEFDEFVTVKSPMRY